MKSKLPYINAILIIGLLAAFLSKDFLIEKELHESPAVKLSHSVPVTQKQTEKPAQTPPSSITPKQIETLKRELGELRLQVAALENQLQSFQASPVKESKDELSKANSERAKIEPGRALAKAKQPKSQAAKPVAKRAEASKKKPSMSLSDFAEAANLSINQRQELEELYKKHEDKVLELLFAVKNGDMTSIQKRFEAAQKDPAALEALRAEVIGNVLKNQKSFEGLENSFSEDVKKVLHPDQSKTFFESEIKRENSALPEMQRVMQGLGFQTKIGDDGEPEAETSPSKGK